jgi:hypothetical protein
VVLFLLPETRGRSLESLEADAPGTAGAPQLTLDPRPTTG